MKNVALLLALLLTSCLTAQEVLQKKSTMSLGSQHAYYVEIEGANNDLLEDSWKAYMKEFGKMNQNKKAKEFVSENVTVHLINGSSPVTIYARFDEGKGTGTAFVWVDMGTGFANPEDFSAQNKGVETFMQDFWVLARKNVIKKELETEEKKLKNFEKDLIKLENKNKDYHSEIEKAKLKIIENEKNIEVNIKDQEAKRSEIELQKTAVQTIAEKLNSVGKSKN